MESWALANILGHQFGIKTDDEFQSIFHALGVKRLRANNTMIHSDEYAWYLGTKEQIINQQTRLKFLSEELKWTGDPSPKWPGGFFFHQEYGLQRIEEQKAMIQSQIPMTIEDSSECSEDHFPSTSTHCEIAIVASPGTYGTLQLEEMWQWTDVQELWGDKFQPYSIDGIFSF